MSVSADDPVFEAAVSRAMEPYRRMGLSDAVLQDMEATVRLALLTHPKAQYLLSRLRQRAPVKTSGKVDTTALVGAPPEAAANDGGGKKR